MRVQRVFLLLIIMALLTAALPSASAQGRTGFTTWFWNPQTLTLLQVDSTTGNATTHRVAFPSGLQPSDYALSISPNGRYLAYCVAQSTERVRQNQTFVVYDWQAQTVAQQLPLTNMLYCGLESGSWSPDSSEVALTVVKYDFTTAPTDPAGSAGEPPINIQIVNVSTGAVNSPVPVAWLDSYTGAAVTYYRPGVELDILSYGYEGPGSLLRFDLQGGAPFNFPPTHYLMQQVETTGEFIAPNYDTTIPREGILGLGDPPYNVLMLHQNGASRPIYYQGSGAIWNATFIEGGNRVALTTSLDLTFLDRALNANHIPIGQDGETFPRESIGTPQGLLVLFVGSNNIQAVLYGTDGIGQVLFTETSAEPYYWRHIGGSVMAPQADLPPFASFDLIATVRASQPAACATILMPRLRVGGYASVIDDTANNLRSGPSLAAEKIGSIPPGGYFEVLEGPVCADGYAFYRIDYNGVQGWTVEGEGSEYWLG